MVMKTYLKPTYLHTCATVVIFVTVVTVVTLVKVVTVVTVVTKQLFSPKKFFQQPTFSPKKVTKNFFYNKKCPPKKSKCEEKKLKILQQSKTLNVTKHKNYKYDKTQNVTKL